jgi:MscS family membrane protein
MRLIDMAVRLKERQWALTASGRITIIQLVSKLSKALAVIACVLIVMYIAGINITAALTGLGIGGIAIAFAAQKALENLFGGIMIISDQPIRVGDFCKAGAYMGTVESIGLRSTYMRTLDRTMVSIPNGQLAVMSLENFAFRDKILFHHFISLHPETTSKQCADVLTGMRKVLQEHPLIEQSTMRVSFVRISDTAFVVEAYAYVLETVYDAFMEIQEALLLKFIEVAERAGAGIAFPAQITQVSPGPARGQRKDRKGGEKQDGLF